MKLRRSSRVPIWGRIAGERRQWCAKRRDRITPSVVIGRCQTREFHRLRIGLIRAIAFATIRNLLRETVRLRIGRIKSINAAQQTIDLSPQRVDDEAALTGIGFTAGRRRLVVRWTPLGQAPRMHADHPINRIGRQGVKSILNLHAS